MCLKFVDGIFAAMFEESWSLIDEQGIAICDSLRDLVAFVQFRKREKHPWRSVNFSKIECLKLTLLHGCFHVF